MTNEEFEKELKRIEQVVTELRNKLLESKVDKKPYEVEVPEDIGDYYFVSELGAITLLKDVFFSAGYEKVYQRGLAFKTKEEAEQFDKERILINRAKDWAKEHQRDWTPDWSNFNETKYYITCKKEVGEFDMNFCRTFRHLIKLPYFKSEEIGEQFIEEFGDEIIEVLC